MKKSILIVLALASITLSNCKKTAAVETVDPVQAEKAALADEATSPKVLLMLQSIKAMPNQDLKRLAYELLSTNEKYFVWLDNIKTAATYSVAQQALINALTDYLSPSLINSKPSAADEDFRDKWLAKAKLVFTRDQIRAIAYQLFPGKDHVVVNDATLTTNQNDGPDGGLPNCNCNTGSDYTCNSKSVCPVDYYHGDCQNATVHGCGFVYWYPCDNTCYVPGSDTTEL